MIRKIIFALIILIFISVSCVSAEEINETSNVTDSIEVAGFEDLAIKVNDTLENQTLTLDCDYEYRNGSVKGIVISKPMTIDGAGHTLNGNKLSRIFNVTADNVVIKNINFVNGDALGSYGIHYGGGAIFWNGTDGYVENCNFTDNGLYTFEYDPYEQDEVIVDDNGLSYVTNIPRPSGATTSQGGAIAWIGDNGKVANSTFRNNRVGYANDGGAIFWAGSNGRIINSEFYDNDAYRGSAIYWSGSNGIISLSTFINSGICDNGIFWTGENGLIRYSILLSDNPYGCVISPYSVKVKADFNFWGDTADNQNMANKSSNVCYWILMNYSANKDFVFEGDSFALNYKFDAVMDKYGIISSFSGLASKGGGITFTSNETGILSILPVISFSQYNYVSSADLRDFVAKKFTYAVTAYNSSGDFYDLLIKIHNTPEGGVLVLDRDYEFKSGFNKGILISKSITIDGAGHTLNGNKLSRIFNVTADDVTVRNVNFINGNAYGRYFSRDVGGGAIYWSGDNGYLFNCSFIRNSGSGIEDDPFDSNGIGMDDDGMIWHTGRMRPMGAKTNEGGAIVWNGTNGTVSKCLFKDNGVGYPNSGGAICWRGDCGKVIASEFISNDAWSGSAICWIGENGSIDSSVFFGNTFGSAIMWFAKTGNISDSILLDSDRKSLYVYEGNVTADNNWWGDTADGCNQISKAVSINSWLVLNFTADKSMAYAGDEITVNCSLYLTNSSGIMKEYMSDLLKLYLDNGDVINLVNGTGQYKFNATSTGALKGIAIVDGKVQIKIQSLAKIKSSDLSKYYKQSKKFKVRVYGDDGKLVLNKKVKFTVNKKDYYVKTDKKGYAALNINLKPGTYSITVQYGNAKAKNKITVKTTLVTKNISKKAKKSAKFKVKVLKTNGKPYPKKNVQIKFKGKTYKIKTNGKGIATFSIPKNLKIGKYTIKTTCNGLTNTNKIIVKK